MTTINEYTRDADARRRWPRSRQMKPSGKLPHVHFGIISFPLSK